ncbi:flippase [Natronobiforma cellulositropha]|uniref:flippase n=1 Tax=Natronobiforma cellulositropha TaxID=1679076 RepID=UPI0021D590C7|nr:flippase [Natronobiforma cellulositropha]
MSLSERIARGVKATFGAEMVHLAAQAGIILVLTRVFLSPDEYGLVFLAVAVFAVAGLFASLGIPKSTAKFIAEYRERDETQLRHVLRVSGTYNALIAGIVCLALFALSGPIAAFYGEPALEPLLVVGVGYVLAHVTQSYLTIVFQGFGRVSLSAAVKATSHAAQFGSVVLLMLAGYGPVGVIGGFVAGYTLGALLGLVLLARLVRECPTPETVEEGLTRRILEYSVPLTASQGANVLYKRVDTLMVGFFLSPLAVGFYELAKQVSTFVIAPADSLGFTVAPTFGEHKSGSQIERASRVYEQSFEYITLLYLPAVAGVVLLAGPGIEFVFGESYLGAVPVLQVFAAFVLFQAIDKITNDSLDYLGRATERAIGKGVTGTLNFLLNLVLIPTIGVVGAALSTAVCFGLMVGYNLYLIDQELELRRLRLLRSVLVTGAITGAMALTILALTPYVTGPLSLFGVIAVGIAVWGGASIASGQIDVRAVRAHI